MSFYVPLTYECAGLRLRSAVPLFLDISPVGGWPDIDIVMGETRPMPYERPSADIVAELVVDRVPWYTFCRVDDKYVGRFLGVVDFEIDASLDHVTCNPTPDANLEVLPILLGGTVLSFILAARGRCVLHGSAVEVDGRAVGFVGASGQGKSTVAAIMCASGAKLVTDDVLPIGFVESDDDITDAATNVFCLRATRELRLRPKAVSLLSSFADSTPRRLTVDERWALSPAMTEHPRLPLSAIVVPRPDPNRSEASGRRLKAGEASLCLARYQRIEGWRYPAHLRRQFLDVSRLAASVPVFEVFVPWGPPFNSSLAEEVLAICQTPERQPLLSALASPATAASVA